VAELNSCCGNCDTDQTAVHLCHSKSRRRRQRAMSRPFGPVYENSAAGLQSASGSHRRQAWVSTDVSPLSQRF
jgi:hypothetical protein